MLTLVAKQLVRIVYRQITITSRQLQNLHTAATRAAHYRLYYIRRKQKSTYLHALLYQSAC
jgi:hypothetical protein